jgi:hypothetical protein
LVERTLHRRAVEAAIWGMPLVNVDAMRQAYFRAGAKYNDVIFWSNPNTWMNQTTTPNHSTSYVMFFMNLKDAPVVVDIPPAKEQALYGTLIDAWNEPQLNVGNTGYDKGAGAKYLLLPPGYKEEPSAGYVPVTNKTYNTYSLLRIIVKTQSEQDMKGGIDYLHTLKIYPLAKASSLDPIQFIDVANKPFEAVPVYDASFYTSLARMVSEEIVQDRDLAIMGQLYSLNIGKGLTFDPDAAMKKALDRAVAEAHQWMMEGYATNGTLIWPKAGRTWRFLLDIPLAEGTAHGPPDALLPGPISLTASLNGERVLQPMDRLAAQDRSWPQPEPCPKRRTLRRERCDLLHVISQRTRSEAFRFDRRPLRRHPPGRTLLLWRVRCLRPIQ